MGNTDGLGPRPLNGLIGYQPWPHSGPDDNSVIVNACESAPLAIKWDVPADDQFWLKGQCYSMNDMLKGDELAHTFFGGCVYQAYLSALSYHRWNAPVSGTVVKVVNAAIGAQPLERASTTCAVRLCSLLEVKPPPSEQMLQEATDVAGDTGGLGT